MAAEVEETLKRLVGHKGVIGTVVVNKVNMKNHSISIEQLTSGGGLYKVDPGPEHHESVQQHPGQPGEPGRHYVQGGGPRQ